jgi:hypothetical protein
MESSHGSPEFGSLIPANSPKAVAVSGDLRF